MDTKDTKEKMDEEVKTQIDYLEVMVPDLSHKELGFIKSALRMAYLTGSTDGIEKMLDIFYAKKKK